MKKRESEFLTYEEIQAFLKMPDKRTLEGKRDYSILLTMLTTGLRKAELCNLKVQDIKTYRNQIVIDVIGKGKRHRRIGLKHNVYKAIQIYTKTHGNGSSDHAIFYTLGKHGLCKELPCPLFVGCLFWIRISFFVFPIGREFFLFRISFRYGFCLSFHFCHYHSC